MSSTFFLLLSRKNKCFLEGGDGLKITVLFQAHCFVGHLYLNIFLVAAQVFLPYLSFIMHRGGASGGGGGGGAAGAGGGHRSQRRMSLPGGIQVNYTIAFKTSFYVSQ